MRFQDKLKMYRLRNSMSQDDLARKMGISRAAIGFWENGKRSPKIEQVMKMADAFGIDWTDLVDDEARINMTVRSDERVLVGSFRQLNAEGKNMLVAFAQSLVYNPLYGPGEGSMKEAMLYDGAKKQKTIEEMTAEELRRLADEKES